MPTGYCFFFFVISDEIFIAWCGFTRNNEYDEYNKPKKKIKIDFFALNRCDDDDCDSNEDTLGWMDKYLYTLLLSIRFFFPSVLPIKL